MDPQLYPRGKRSSDPAAHQQQQQNLHHQLQQQHHHDRLRQQETVSQSQRSQEPIIRHQERRESGVESTSRRADRRQPIIIQNFELLPPGQSHLKRRSLSTANLFLSSASLRRETEVSSTTRAVERVQLYNSPSSDTQTTAGVLPPNHTERRDLPNSVRYSDTPVSKKQSLACITDHSDSISSDNSPTYNVNDAARDKLSRVYDHPYNSEEKPQPRALGWANSSMKTSSDTENGPKKYVKIVPRSVDPKSELSRAHSFPILSNGHQAKKKAKTKKQVTFADTVSVPWPYTLVHEGKMWSTGNDVEEIPKTPYTDSTFSYTDINNNTDAYSAYNPFKHGNIFRPMASKGDPCDINAKQPSKVYHGILKKSKSNIDSNSTDTTMPVNQRHCSKDLPETELSKDKEDRNAPYHYRDIVSESALPLMHDSNSIADVQRSSHRVQNGQFSEQYVENNGEKAAVEENFISFQSNTRPVQENGHFEPQLAAETGCVKPATENILTGSENMNKTCESLTYTSNGNDGDQSTKRTQGLEIDENDVHRTSIIEQPFGREDYSTSCLSTQDQDAMESKHTGLVKDEIPPKEDQAAVDQSCDSMTEVTTYTVPQLVDSIDLSDYLSDVSRPGSVAGRLPTTSAFRPGPTNARLNFKAEVSRTTPGTSETIHTNSKGHSGHSSLVNADSDVVMRFKFLKDEPDTKARQPFGAANNSHQTKSRPDDCDTFTMKVAGKGLELYQHPSLVSVADESLGEEPPDMVSVPARPLKPFNGRPGQMYLAAIAPQPKTQGEMNTDYLMQMYSSTGERRVDTDNSHNNGAIAWQAPLTGIDKGDIRHTIDSTQRPQSSITQRSRIAATTTTPVSPMNVSIDVGRSYLGNGTNRRSRESRRDVHNRKEALPRDDAFSFTPRSRERQRSLLTATLVGDPSPDLNGGVILTPRAVIHARARSSSASGCGMMLRGRNHSAHERTLGAMENAFLPERQRSARGGARGPREGVAYSVGRTQLNRRLEMLVLSTTRPNTAMERQLDKRAGDTNTLQLGTASLERAK
ncbi:hypothetical protein ElyMa_006686800 [Elysia marginata]|uniref:Wiskott-Aldrich syndrome protein family member n=1 Tax=Elysia marginata TaxID=1093978 RepID=A0AAV4INR5_9GAST|nr:hypothetical protein ElyMa_006686800 [Elysia marginata]